MDIGRHSPHPNNRTIELESLYAVLTYRGELASWNWAFFVASPTSHPTGTSGTIFRVADIDGEWKFVTEVKDVVSSPMVVALVKLGDVSFLGSYEDVVGADALPFMFRLVKIPSQAELALANNRAYNSRTWFLDAISMLHDHAVVTCDDVWLLESEIIRYAFAAMDPYLGNKGWSVYRSERCST
ncbi:hypothetical protein BDN72DRAFT_823384 [Pluteus cervinus]|uniref:Uncharacterized protein n=1 Tax=Pluteus cervinus TaxID=181527 RepID=A0ACD3AL31_9AGAR|nr:hypothetical protein BDN72DRAFT_823384 [Pluteus cervinus]